MYFIGKHKISEYIKAHPESETAFLMWLKESNEQYEDSYALDKHLGHMGVSYGTCSIGSTHRMEVHHNKPLRTVCIMWIGTNAEHEAKQQQDFEKFFADNPGEGLVVKEVRSAKGGKSYTSKAIARMRAEQAETPEPTAFTFDGYKPLRTANAYHKAMNKAIAMFGAEPGTAAHQKLIALLPSIIAYEDEKFIFPELTLVDAVKLRIEMIGHLKPEDLKWVIGIEEDEVELFLSGQMKLPAKALKKLQKRLTIPPLKN